MKFYLISFAVLTLFSFINNVPVEGKPDADEGEHHQRRMYNCSRDGLEQIPNSDVCNFVDDCKSTRSDEINCGDCDFERGFCGYKPVLHFDWNIADKHKQVTRSGRGRLNGSRNFVYTSKNSARLISPFLNTKSDQCKIIFDYLFNDASDTKLYLLVDLGHTEPHEIWNSMESHTKYENTGKWYTAEVNVQEIHRPFRVIFKASISDNDSCMKFIAIDDIKFINCSPSINSNGQEISCPLDRQFKCANDFCVDTAYRCDYENDCGDNSDEIHCDQSESYRCDFESGQCMDWTGIGYEKGVWRVKSPMHLKSKPARDHTYKSSLGHFLYFSPNEKFHSNDLISPVIDHSDQCLLRFFYSSCVKGFASLEIYGSNVNESDVLIDSVISKNNLNFHRKVIDLTGKIKNNFTLKFVANFHRFDRNYCHYFAIDDISFSHECIYQLDALSVIERKRNGSIYIRLSIMMPITTIISLILFRCLL